MMNSIHTTFSIICNEINMCASWLDGLGENLDAWLSSLSILFLILLKVCFTWINSLSPMSSSVNYFFSFSVSYLLGLWFLSLSVAISLYLITDVGGFSYPGAVNGVISNISSYSKLVFTGNTNGLCLLVHFHLLLVVFPYLISVISCCWYLAFCWALWFPLFVDYLLQDVDAYHGYYFLLLLGDCWCGWWCITCYLMCCFCWFSNCSVTGYY